MDGGEPDICPRGDRRGRGRRWWRRGLRCQPPCEQSNVFGLEQLQVEQSAAVVLMKDAENPMMIRLKTMGLHEGRAVRMLRQGSRLVIQCGGTRIGMSAEVARLVLVKTMDSSHRATSHPATQGS
ncbi:MAG: ferrous iron transport protein A [Phycisphaeraceae bacterium]|nr:ferrous iron transport protein A [Phycisphaeraceae bacterium]